MVKPPTKIGSISDSLHASLHVCAGYSAQRFVLSRDRNSGLRMRRLMRRARRAFLQVLIKKTSDGVAQESNCLLRLRIIGQYGRTSEHPQGIRKSEVIGAGQIDEEPRTAEVLPQMTLLSAPFSAASGHNQHRPRDSSKVLRANRRIQSDSSLQA